MPRIYLFIFCFSFLIAHPSSVLAKDKLPKIVKKAIQSTKIPANSIGFNVTSVSKNTNSNFQFGWNASNPMNPASTMKVLTTAAGLDILGAQYKWKTNIYTNGTLIDDTLNGDLIFQGFGDPKLVPEQMSQIVTALRQLGIKNIQGNLIFDRTAYAPSVRQTAPNDGETKRTYNVVPDPLLFSFQTLSFQINSVNSEVKISYTPKLAGLHIINKINLTNTACGDWAKDLKINIAKISDNEWNASFIGKLSKNCGEILWNTVALEPNDFLKLGFLAGWEEVGGGWKKTIQAYEGVTPSNAKLLISYQGTLLSDAIKDINKYSNNVMARQLFLTLGLEKNGKPTSTGDSTHVIKDWLKKSNLNFPELVLENGSGLSNIERISPDSMTRLLNNIIYTKKNDVWVNSLPVAGVDGTMKNRLSSLLKKIWSPSNVSSGFIADQTLPVALQKTGAYMKTGTLQNVRAIAGYVVSKSGRVYAVSSMVNHPNASAGGSLINDAIISWVINDCPND
jgi:D-alanyl-D-alanine carboxypeptidase/D-alanyl-D-alanine-endopeptidase (penicillin-binding protein 4)